MSTSKHSHADGARDRGPETGDNSRKSDELPVVQEGRDAVDAGKAGDEESFEPAGHQPAQMMQAAVDDLHAAHDKLTAAEKEINDLRSKFDGLQDKYVRLMAEFDNYKKRTNKEYSRLIEQANERLMVDLIEVRENLERAIKPGKDSVDAQTLFDGARLIAAKLSEVLGRHGLAAFGEPGDAFNAELHDALMKSPHERIAEDRVAEVFEKGYRLKDRVIRHARVIVSSGKPPAAGPLAVPEKPPADHSAPEKHPKPAAHRSDAGTKSDPDDDETVFEPKK